MTNATHTPMPEGYYVQHRSEMLPFIPPHTKRMLDVGCAEGGFASLVLTQRPNIEIWGIEPVEQAAQKAQVRLTKVLCCGIETAIDQLPAGHFDCITFNDVLEHLVDPWAVLKMMRDKLAQGGQLLASIPNLRYFPVIKQIIQEADLRYTHSGVLDRTHLRFFTQKSMIQMFKDCGYRVERIVGINGEKLPFKFALINRLVGGAWNDMQYKQFAVAAQAVD